LTILLPSRCFALNKTVVSQGEDDGQVKVNEGQHQHRSSRLSPVNLHDLFVMGQSTCIMRVFCPSHSNLSFKHFSESSWRWKMNRDTKKMRLMSSKRINISIRLIKYRKIAKQSLCLLMDQLGKTSHQNPNMKPM